MAYDNVLVARRGAVGIVTLNRPEKLNAINLAVSHDIRDAVAELNADEAIGALVLTGAGRAFSAGGDIGRIEGMKAEAPEQPSLPNIYWLEQARASKPIVVAVNGLCLGAAFGRTLCCDVRIASTQAVFSTRFVKLGLGPEMAMTQMLPNLIGIQAAADLMLSARMFDAAEALRLGIVLKVVEPEALIDEAVALAAEYAANPRGAVKACKDLIHVNALEREMTLVLRREGDAQQALANTPEMLEAMAALKEKRSPDFAAARARAAGA